MERCYGTLEISERHRHRYEFNNDYREALTSAGLVSYTHLDVYKRQEGRRPAAGDAHTAQVQSLLQLGRVGGILVADLAAGEAGQSHLADGLLEGRCV